MRQWTQTPRISWPLLPLVLAFVPNQKFLTDFKIAQCKCPWCLGPWSCALQKFIMDFMIFQCKCPFQNENENALSKMKF